MTWKLEGQETAYEHFVPPFLLTTSVLYQKIRNVQLRIVPAEGLVPVEVAKYDQKVILEALHNCIAHQDYLRNGRIIVTEQIDKLSLENEGSFFEGQPDDYTTGNKTPRRYRNPFLTQAMTELNMIDTMGYGIHQMFVEQAKRYLPIPDYDLTSPQSVKLTIHGKVVDPAFSRLLIQQTALSIADILALDRIQKKLSLPEETIIHLKHAKLIEGRKPNYHIAASVAKTTAHKVAYIKTRAQDDEFYKKQITDYLKKFKEASYDDIKELLWNKLSDALNPLQKANKISNLLTNMRRAGDICNTGSKKIPQWKLAD